MKITKKMHKDKFDVDLFDLAPDEDGFPVAKLPGEYGSVDIAMITGLADQGSDGEQARNRDRRLSAYSQDVSIHARRGGGCGPLHALNLRPQSARSSPRLASRSMTLRSSLHRCRRAIGTGNA